MSMSKIVHLITGLTVGGAEQMLLRTVSKLEGDHSVWSIIPRGKIGEELEAMGVDVRYLNLRSIGDIRVPLRLYQWLRQTQPDIIVTYLLHADILGRIIGRLTKVPMIISSIRCAHQDKHLLVWLSRLTAPLAHAYIAVSQSVKLWTIQRLKVPADKITVIYNGVDCNGVDCNGIDSVGPTKITTHHPLTISFIGRLDAQKGLTYFIEAIRLLTTKSVPPYQVQLVGDGIEKARLEELITRYGLAQVTLLGFRRDITAILGQTDIFVSPTLFEGISNSIMEAMAAGLPVITTSIPENLELIENNQNGIVVPARNAQALADGIELLLNDEKLRQHLGAAAHATIRERFTIETTIKQLNQLFASVYVRNRR